MTDFQVVNTPTVPHRNECFYYAVSMQADFRKILGATTRPQLSLWFLPLSSMNCRN